MTCSPSPAPSNSGTWRRTSPPPTCGSPRTTWPESMPHYPPPPSPATAPHPPGAPPPPPGPKSTPPPPPPPPRAPPSPPHPPPSPPTDKPHHAKPPVLGPRRTCRPQSEVRPPGHAAPGRVTILARGVCG